jgi:N4-(beta-N-acetylglucosaminyl)-L-asparaginase
MERRKFLQYTSFGLPAVIASRDFEGFGASKPLVISTWNAGIPANAAAWKILRKGGRALDAVEAGVMVTEDSQNCCVGLGANPDREGKVTLDASIMDEHGNAGAVAFLERIKHPISVARRVMEKTPHVMLVGAGAQQFAVEEGFPLEKDELSPDAKRSYENWLKTSKYQPVINIENKKEHGPFAPSYIDGEFNHDTIGMLALDSNSNLSGSCTTSGMGFKMRGRLGDSPIIGAGLFVDNEIGAAVSTGLGEEVIKVCGTHLVVEFMRNGYSPENACKAACERIIKRNKGNVKDIQVGFLAVNKKGVTGAYAIQKGFSYALCSSDSSNKLVSSKFLM